MTVGLDLRVFQISGTWEPNDDERKAAWELYVELVTRIAVVPLDPAAGLLREALASLYSLFATTREILRRYGPDIAEPKPEGPGHPRQHSFGFLAVSMLNLVLRPVLATWHPALEDWEATKPPEHSRGQHEQTWDRAPELRSALDGLRDTLSDYARLMAKACGVPDLLAAVTKAADSSQA